MQPDESILFSRLENQRKVFLISVGKHSFFFRDFVKVKLEEVLDGAVKVVGPNPGGRGLGPGGGDFWGQEVIRIVLVTSTYNL